MSTSMIARAEALLVRVLPPETTESLKKLKARLPLKLPQAPPVAAMYIADGETRSYVGLNNFYSFLLAQHATEATATLRFFSPDGTRLLDHRVDLAHFGATMVDVSQLFARKKIRSPYGIVALQVTPKRPRDPAYRELGRVHSVFFVSYQAKGSIAQVHPLSEIGPHNVPGQPFVSSQVITTRGLAAIELFQYNPGTRTQPLEHRLVDPASGAIVARKNENVPGLGSCRTKLTVADLERVPERLLFTVDRLPSGNSKPMLRRCFHNGVHTMSHS